MTARVRLPLHSDRLILRDYREQDWERVHLYGGLPEFSRFEAWGPNKIEDTKKFIADRVRQALFSPRSQYELAVCLKDSDLLIGGSGLRRETQDSHVASLGWAINPQFQNQGYASEAARRLIRFGFEELKLKVIYATCDTRNVASFKVMEKVGMTSVGFIKGHMEVKGYLRDTYRYEITQSEFSKSGP